MRKFILTLFSTTVFLFHVKAQNPCENGLADGRYPCNQIDLMSHVEPEDLQATLHNGFYLNDLWGWTDPTTGSEYVIVGLKDGVSFVDISNPTSPEPLGKLPETVTAASKNASSSSKVLHGKSTWRDIKVYQNHAFIVSDLNENHGMQVFDLTRLRGLSASSSRIFDTDGFYTGVQSAHNIVINEATGFAYIVGISSGGGDCGEGGLHILDISNPTNPIYTACFDEDGYTHDAQCVIYEGADADYVGREICFNANENTFTVADVHQKDSIYLVSRTGYDRNRYAHQGWLSEDHRFFIMNDELDENAFGFNPRTLIWDIEDLDAPVLIGEYYHEATAIDHNLYTHNNKVYASNYLTGLRILDMERVDKGIMREMAFFDTYPSTDAIEFGGAWTNYPYFESGNVAVSDMNNGLFILRLNLDDDPIEFHPTSSTVCEGATVSFSVVTSEENLTYQWQRFNGKKFTNVNDFQDVVGATTDSLTFNAKEAFEDIHYRCKITDNQGKTFYSFPATYQIEGKQPIAGFDINVGEEGVVTFTNTSEFGENFEWIFGDGNTANTRDATHQFDYGDYQVSLIVSNQCGTDTLTQTTFIITGIDDESKVFSLYPNPAKDVVNVFTQSTAILSLRSLSGKLVKRITIGSGAHLLQLDGLKPGMYFVTIETDQEPVTKRLMVR